MNNLLRYNDNQKIIAWDTETCNLNLLDLNNKLWNIGYIILEGEKVIEKRNRFIWWDDLRMSPDAARITRFDYNNYKQKAEPAELVLKEFEQYLYNKDYINIFQNGLNFDIYIHNIWRHNLGFETDYSYVTRSYDTNALAKAIKLNIPYCGKNNKDLLAFQFRMLSIFQKGLKTSLTTLGKELNIENVDFNQLHDGLADVELMMKIWNKWIKWKIEI